MRITTEPACVDQPMKGAVCLWMMCGLPREDFRNCKQVIVVHVTATGSLPSLRMTVADGRGLRRAWRAATTVRVAADHERLVGELVRSDLG